MDQSDWDQMRIFWNEFDPIGVSSSVDDEYDSYVGSYLKLLKDETKSESDLTKYLELIVYDHMGLNRHSEIDSGIKDFISKTQRWEQEN